MNKTEILINKARKLNIKVQLVSKNKKIFRFIKNNQSKYVVGELAPLNNSVGTRLSKDKHITKNILNKIGIKTPQGFLLHDWKEVHILIKTGKLSYPLVVKPNEKAAGTDVAANIQNIKELKTIVSLMEKKYPDFIVEKYCEGDDHRLTVIDGKVVASCKRVRPFIIGDGVSSLEELIEVFNKKREYKVKVDNEVLRSLKKQGIGLDSIIEKDKKVNLRENSNMTTGGMVVDVTDMVNPKFKKIAVKAVSELSLRFAGVDIITPDISKDSKYVITEINGLPGWDIHINPDYGLSRDISGFILDALWKY